MCSGCRGVRYARTLQTVTKKQETNNDTAPEIIGMMTTRTTTKHTYADAERLMLLK